MTILPSQSTALVQYRTTSRPFNITHSYSTFSVKSICIGGRTNPSWFSLFHCVSPSRCGWPCQMAPSWTAAMLAPTGVGGMAGEETGDKGTKGAARAASCSATLTPVTMRLWSWPATAAVIGELSFGDISALRWKGVAGRSAKRG